MEWQNLSQFQVNYEKKIATAIKKSPDQKLTTEDIFEYFVKNVDYVRKIEQSCSWKVCYDVTMN